MHRLNPMKTIKNPIDISIKGVETSSSSLDKVCATTPKMVHRAYTFKIKTDKNFENKFNQWIGICRFLYNCALECKITAYKTQGKTLTNYDLQKQLTVAKKEILWLKTVNSQTLQTVLDRLEIAFHRFYNNIGYGYPKYASKKKWKSISFKTIRFKNNQFILPTWGVIKLFKNRLPKGELKIARIVKEADGYYLHVISKELYQNINENQVGIDIGVNNLAVTSNNEFVANPKINKKYERKLRIENRSLSRKERFSNSWFKQLKRVQLIYLKIKRARKDYLHKETTKLCRNYGYFYLEDIKILGVVANSNLSKHIFDCGWGYFKTYLSYKGNVVLVDPKYTSQTCSNCGHCEKGNRVSQSNFQCKICGHSENADFNASKNILGKGIALMRQRKGSYPMRSISNL